MKIVINLLSLSGPDGRSAVSGLEPDPSLRAATPQELGAARDDGPSLFDDEDEGADGGGVSNRLDTTADGADGAGDVLAAMQELVDEELRRAHDALLRRVPGGMDDAAGYEEDEESAWLDELEPEPVSPGPEAAQALRDAPLRRRIAEPLCADCAKHIAEAVLDDGAYAAGVHLVAPLRGTIGNLDGWCLEVDPDRVRLRDLHGELVLEFRRIAGQWFFDRAGL